MATHLTHIPWQGKEVVFGAVNDISEGKHRESELRQELALWQLLMEHANDGIVIIDGASLAAIDVNPAFAQMLGYTREEMIGMHPWDWDARFSRSEIEELSTAHRVIAEERRFETLHCRKDGSLRDVEVTSTPAEMGDRFLFFCFCRDITERNRDEQLLRSREQEFRSLAENAPDGIVRYDRQLHRLYVNPVFERLLGKDKSHLLGRSLLSDGPLDLQTYKSAIETAFKTGCQQEAEVRHIKTDGTLGWFHSRFEPEFAVDGTVHSVLVVIRDISYVVEQRELARRLAHTDTLTGLPNRALFEKCSQDAATRSDVTSRPFALLMLDLDHFKEVNDTLGHQAGDELLRQVTTKLSNCIRETDTIARLGGDEFAVLQHHIHSAADATELATRILTELSQPFLINHKELFISGSIGITFYPADSRDLEQLFTFADTAMYSAKRKGRNNYQLYSEKLTHHITKRLSLGAALRNACLNKELQLHYQPKVQLETGQTVGAEALVRWQHPELGLLSPARFIASAEDSGLIIDIGGEILQTACQAAVRLNRNRSASFRIAVNLSSRQFVQHDLAGEVRAILKTSGCRGEWLEFEITENLMIDDNRQVRRTLEELRALGITIAIDDFGTGYSALNYLTRFPMDVLKIDRSFTNGIETDPRKAGLVQAFIAVGKTLDMEIVAEGIETAAQSQMLQQLGCRLGQGYLFGKPLPFEDLLNCLAESPEK